jgi:polar amino acid transport system substrate-binding protein
LHRPSAVVLSVVTFLLSACGGDDEATGLLRTVKDRGSIVIGTDANYPPQSVQAGDGTWSGFDVDVGRAVATRLGVTPQFVSVDFDTVITGDWGGQYDMLADSVTITSARLAVLRFSDPYYFSPAQYAAPKNKPINSFADLNGRKICVGSGTTYEDYLAGRLSLPASSIYAAPPTGVTIVSVDTDSICVDRIRANDASIDAFLSASTLIAAQTDVLEPFSSYPYAEQLALVVDGDQRVDSRDFLKAVNEGVDTMRADGTLTALSLQYFGKDLTQTP